MKLDQSKLLPNAHVDEYFLRIFDDVPLKCKTGFVGYVGNSTNPDIHIEIEIDDKYMYEHNLLSCCLWINLDDYPKSIIVMTSSFFDEIRNSKAILYGTIWHEIGHFHTMRYFNTERTENGSTNKTREEYFKQREIMPEEKTADLFALYYTSLDDMVQHMNFMIKRRRSNIYENRDVNDRAVAELARRKRFLREIDASEENIRKMLCDLCCHAPFDTL